MLRWFGRANAHEQSLYSVIIFFVEVKRCRYCFVLFEVQIGAAPASAVFQWKIASISRRERRWQFLKRLKNFFGRFSALSRCQTRRICWQGKVNRDTAPFGFTIKHEASFSTSKNGYADEQNCLAQLTVALKPNQGARRRLYIAAGVLFFRSFFCTSKRKNIH